MALLEINGIIFPMNKKTTKQQLKLVNEKMEELVDRIAKNNADNLKSLCEIWTVLSNIQLENYKTNEILLK